MDCIEVRRNSTKFSAVVFTKGTNDWNLFSLYELIAVEYGFLSGVPGGESLQNGSLVAPEGLQFPDFSRLRIRQPTADHRSWQEGGVTVPLVFETNGCAGNLTLDWGDVVELPESDHPLNQSWPGFPTADFEALKKCLTRQVEIVIKGQGKNITIAPDPRFVRRTPFLLDPMKPVTKPSFWLKPVLRESGLLLASSDLSRVTVIRGNPAAGAVHKWVIDCSEGKPAPDFWLMNGDRVEVPERTN
jgi:hypothetical protein